MALLNGDLVVVYRGEARHGDVLNIRVAAADFHRYGFDLCFPVSDRCDGREIAQAKMGMLLFDFAQRCLLPMSEAVKQAVRAAPDGAWTTSGRSA